MCQSKFYLNVNFVKPVLNRNALYLVYIIVAIIITLLMFVSFQIARRYWIYKTKKNSIEQEISIFAREGIHLESEELPVK